MKTLSIKSRRKSLWWTEWTRNRVIAIGFELDDAKMGGGFL